MLAKTHLAIGAFAVVFFLPHVTHKIIFVPIVLIASLLPDIDNGFSTFGRKGIFRPLQLFSKHRGIFHSFTFTIFVAFILALYTPTFAFPFFLGYGLHILADSWTVEGVRPFWPLKHATKGRITTGGTIEESIFLIFMLLDVIFLILVFV